MRFRAKVLSVLPRVARECYGAANARDAEERAATMGDEILTELRQLMPEELEQAHLQVLPESDGEE